jgi:hypothetical protein
MMDDPLKYLLKSGALIPQLAELRIYSSIEDDYPWIYRIFMMIKRNTTTIDLCRIPSVG